MSWRTDFILSTPLIVIQRIWRHTFAIGSRGLGPTTAAKTVFAKGNKKKPQIGLGMFLPRVVSFFPFSLFVVTSRDESDTRRRREAQIHER